MTDFEKSFLDTSFFIYHIEKDKRYAPATRAFLISARTKRSVLCTSVVSVMEFSVKPHVKNDKELLDRFRNFLLVFPVFPYDINFDIADRAAKLRAQYAFLKGLDALQLAAAIEHGCDAFLTNDRKLKAIKDIEVFLIEDLVQALLS
jgi:predicted nucleic acid-binding protein